MAKSVPSKPKLKDLGSDLLQVHWFRKLVSLIMIFLLVTAYFFFAKYEMWICSIIAIMGFTFFSYPSISHDLVHQTWALPTQLNHILLSIIEGLALRSGTAYRLTHLNHHRTFPSPNDIEGEAAYKSLWKAILDGPLYISRLWIWSWKKAPKDRLALAIELTWISGYLFFSLVQFQNTPIYLIYAVLMVGGSWFFPLCLSYIQHTPHAKEEIYQTRLYRGKFFEIIFLRHNYHLEHHMYSSVPHYNWHKLSKRLNPYLKKFNLEVVTISKVLKILFSKKP